MQISEVQFSTDRLSALGVEAIGLLRSGEYSVLAERFGYALAFQRDPAVAIQEDLASCLVKLHAAALSPVASIVPGVRYFPPTEGFIVSLVEIWVPADNGRELLVELIVSGEESNRHVTLEDISVPT